MVDTLRAFAPLREIVFCACLAIAFCFAGIVDAENWDRFRGPNGAGQSETAGIPSEWTESDYLWKKPLPGVGHSSPVVWGEKLFVTSGDPATGELILLALDANTGDQLWEKRIASHTYSMHRDNSYATSTPAVDADSIYLLWLDGDKVTLAAFSHDGAPIWTRQVGSLVEQHGFGTSPIIVGDMIVVANETNNVDRSAVIGIDRRTGEVRWTQPRGTGKTAFATPFVMEAADGRKLVVMSSMGSGVTAYDPATGVIEWQVLEHDLPDRCVSSPIVAGGLIIVSCGSGNNGLHLIALRPGENGAPPEEAYRLRQGVPNIPTPIVAGDMLLLWHDRGTVTCLDAVTGEQHWRKRVSGMFHSSPVRIGNRIFGLSREGEVVVLAAEKEYQLIARNDLGERCQATPAVADGKIFYRTEESLIAIGKHTGG
ncbi:MAG: PQQ-binding-like beta-propeller repeat protein [Pirellulales bacterium]